MKIESLGVVLLEFRPEARHGIRRHRPCWTIHQLSQIIGRSTDGRILVPGALRELALVARGQGGSPALRDLLAECDPKAADLLAVVVIASPLRIVRYRTVDPGAGGQRVVDEAAVIVLEAGNSQCRPVLDERNVEKALDRAVVGSAIDLAAVQVYPCAERLGIC